MAAATQPKQAPKTAPKRKTTPRTATPATPDTPDTHTTEQSITPAYTHSPRPGHRTAGQYHNQIRYGDGGFNCAEIAHGPSAGTNIQVYRDAISMVHKAELSISSYTAGHGLSWTLQAELSPSQLEALAFALLDAAADIRSLKGGAA